MTRLSKKKYTVAFVYRDEEQAFETRAMLTANEASEVEEYLQGFHANNHISDVQVFEPSNTTPHATKAALMRELGEALEEYHQ